MCSKMTHKDIKHKKMKLVIFLNVNASLPTEEKVYISFNTMATNFRILLQIIHTVIHCIK